MINTYLATALNKYSEELWKAESWALQLMAESVALGWAEKTRLGAAEVLLA